MSVYSWGANSHGQLGLGFESELCVSPQRLTRVPFNPASVRMIRGGGGHVLVVDKTGRLFSCGWNNRGQLGIGCIGDQNEFQPISADFLGGSAVEQVACGWDSSGALTVANQLYMWGSNSFQQLGICQRGFSHVTRPLHVALPRNERAVHLSIGLRHSCIVTDENRIYVFGRVRLAETPPGITVCRIPFNKGEIYRLQAEIKVKMVASGQNHIILTDGQKIIGLGENKYGQANMFTFDAGIVQIASGWTHNGVLTAGSNSELLMWGRNSYGQVGGGGSGQDSSVPTPQKIILPDSQTTPGALHLGSEHGMLVSDKGDILTWGWNEHGNCGNGDVENVYKPTLIALPSSCIIAGTGAGFCYAVCDK